MSKPATHEKRKSERVGHIAETLVMCAYALRGYRLLARRYRCHQGEIDLIMRRRRTIAFIEVKFRRRMGDIETALPSPRQQKRIRAAAGYFLARYRGGENPEARIDLVIMHGLFRRQVFENAF